ncbi:MAG TPA: hypothetical protein VGP93_00045 [Polyangiaceae bacterium]|nr:hypothetical protein [Polyangiaceae bacterium]
MMFSGWCLALVARLVFSASAPEHVLSPPQADPSLSGVHSPGVTLGLSDLGGEASVTRLYAPLFRSELVHWEERQVGAVLENSSAMQLGGRTIDGKKRPLENPDKKRLDMVVKPHPPAGVMRFGAAALGFGILVANQIAGKGAPSSNRTLTEGWGLKPVLWRNSIGLRGQF